MSGSLSPAQPRSGARGVFIVGCPRSGTTLVGEAVASHPACANLEESYAIYLLHLWRAMQAPPVAPTTDELVTGARRLIQGVVSRYVGAHTHFVDHTPFHVLALADVWDAYPTAVAVHVVRNPVDVVRSLERSFESGRYPWAGSTDGDRVALWARCAAAGVEAGSEHPERVVNLRYEEVVRAPAPTMQGLLARVGLSWDDHVLRPFEALQAGETSDRAPAGRTGSSDERAMPAARLESIRAAVVENREAGDLAAALGYLASASTG